MCKGAAGGREQDTHLSDGTGAAKDSPRIRLLSQARKHGLWLWLGKRRRVELGAVPSFAILTN